MYATGMATALEQASLDVLELDGWKTRGRAPLDGVKTIVVHHTGTSTPGDFPTKRVLVEGRSDLPGPLCNLAVTRSARWVAVAAGRANHAGAVLDPSYGNDWSLGVEVENNGKDEPWTAELLESLALGIAALCEHYDVPTARVLGHREVCAPKGRKSDPNTSMTNLRAAVAAARTSLKEDPFMALSNADAEKIADAIVGKLLAWDTIPNNEAIEKGATPGTPEGSVSLRTVFSKLYDAAKGRA